MDVRSLYIIRKDSLSRCLFYVGVIMAYVTSMHPWFVWNIRIFVYLLCAMVLSCSAYLSRQTRGNIFNRSTFLIPWGASIALMVYELLVSDANVNGYIGLLFHITIFFFIYRVDTSLYRSLSNILAKMMAVFMIFSMLAFFLYLLGFPLPHSNISHPSGNYSFTNYYLFLLDDRFMAQILPRFHSIVLEPGHLGAALAVLLMSQCGQLTRWYNLILLVTTFLTLSLAAYVLLFVGSFLVQWMQGRAVLKWLVAAAVVAGISAVVIVNYNDGENMLNEMILLRLEVEDGELAGDNRVSDDFLKEFDGFLSSPDLVFGRGAYEEKKLHGNSGYRLYLYEKGIVGVFFVILFYGATLFFCRHRRATLSAFLIAVLLFIVRANPLWYFDFLGVYMIACQFDESRIIVPRKEGE